MTRTERTAPVLVVDDDPSILDLVTDILVGEGYRVLGARHGREALEHLAAERPCAVLLDMRMPTMDGWAFAAAMRARGVRYPVIVMTAAENARLWAEEIGAEAYLAKPFGLLELVRTVEDFCVDPAGPGPDPSAGAPPAYH